VGEHPRTFDVRWHSHDHWELVYCTSGKGKFQLEDGTAIEYHQGEAVAIPPKMIHMNSSKDGFTNIHLNIADPMFPYRNAFMVEDDAECHMKIAFAQAKFYYLSDIRRQELVMAALGELIISYMIVYRANQEYSEPVEQIRTSIIKNVANSSFALDEEIRRMPFHYDYLRKLFKREMGLTPLEYMINLRMKRAEGMLTAMWSREYSIAEVAESCGFSDALYFSRVFKKHFGCAPTAFVKQRQERSSESKEPPQSS